MEHGIVKAQLRFVAIPEGGGRRIRLVNGISIETFFIMESRMLMT